MGVAQAENESVQKTVTAVVVDNFPPHYSLDDNGHPQGFAIDVIEQIAKHADLKIKYIIKDSWTETANTLKRGQADLIPNLGISQSRQRHFDFSTPVETFSISIIVRAETKKIRSIEDLAKKIVGVIKYNIGAKIVKELPNVFSIIYDQPENALIALLSGYVDAVVYPKSVMLKVARDSRLSNRIKIVGKPVKEIKRGVAVQAGNKELLGIINNGIEKFSESGQHEAIYAKWYGKPEPFWTVFRVILISGLIIFFVTILFIFWKYYYARKLNKKLIRNIEKREKAEKALKENSIFLHKTQEIAHLGSWELDLESNELRWSDEVYRIFGLNPQEITPTYELFLSFVHPDDTELVNTVYRESLENNQDEYEVEHRLIKRSTGEMRYVFEKCEHVRDNNGKIIRSVGIVHDITDRKLAEKERRIHKIEQRQIIDNMLDAVITIDEQGLVQIFSKSAEKLFGYAEKEIVGQNVKVLMPNEYADKHDQYLVDFKKTNVSNIIGVGREVTGQHKDGSIFPIRLSIAELPGKDDISKYYVGTCHDLTLEKQTEEQLRRSQKMDAIGNLTGGIAHDFNNMLGIILGYGGLLRESLLGNKELSEFVDHINKAGERGATLTQKLLSFSRAKESEAQITDINTVILEQKQLLEKTLTVRINLNVDLTDDLWLINVDRGDLEDSILNITINAMHAMESGGSLTIKTQKQQLGHNDALGSNLAPGDYVVLSITDTGIGMDEAVQGKIFEPFFSSKGHKGTGLGLSMAYGFMQRSGGIIKVNSKLGQGSTFSLYFPRCNQPQVDFPIKDTNVGKNVTGSGSILVVDDEQAMAEFAYHILVNNGYQVVIANSAEQGLDILKTKSFDLVLSDVIMPGMDGHKFSAIIKKQYQSTKIGLISGYYDEMNKAGKDPAENNIITKPYTGSVLLERVRDLLGQDNSTLDRGA